MAEQLKAGTFQFQLDGVLYSAKGVFTYNLGRPKRDAIVGPDGIHGFKETIQVPYIEGALTDSPDLDLDALLRFKNGTATLQLANGKVLSYRDAYYAGEGNVTTEESEIGLRIEAINAEEVPA